MMFGLENDTSQSVWFPSPLIKLYKCPVYRSVIANNDDCVESQGKQCSLVLNLKFKYILTKYNTRS